ncbi:hypothetical protein [Polyangium spumosum]|uniref:hypothetical protein n=1 Tax=Polyangium spumosum TaxID=889282 RepID=UPI001478EA86|nr:hypothetical protein [Polyangium spumosum]
METSLGGLACALCCPAPRALLPLLPLLPMAERMAVLGSMVQTSIIDGTNTERLSSYYARPRVALNVS